MLENGLYEGSAKSSLMIPYMEAIQRRLVNKGWTTEQLDAIMVTPFALPCFSVCAHTCSVFSAVCTVVAFVISGRHVRLPSHCPVHK